MALNDFLFFSLYSFSCIATQVTAMKQLWLLPCIVLLNFRDTNFKPVLLSSDITLQVPMSGGFPRPKYGYFEPPKILFLGFVFQPLILLGFWEWCCSIFFAHPIEAIQCLIAPFSISGPSAMLTHASSLSAIESRLLYSVGLSFISSFYIFWLLYSLWRF